LECLGGVMENEGHVKVFYEAKRSNHCSFRNISSRDVNVSCLVNGTFRFFVFVRQIFLSFFLIISCRTGTASIFNIIPPKQHLYERRGTQKYEATTVAAESPIAQLHSQG
jgi:hypothetical protein